MSLQRRSMILDAAGCAALAAIAILAGAAEPREQTPAPSATAQTPTTAAAPGTRHKQLADDSDRLLALAMSLKAEVDKTTKDTLSINVIRRADEIEKLAHNLRAHMKASGTAS